MDELRLGEEIGQEGKMMDVGLSLVPITALSPLRGKEQVDTANGIGIVLDRSLGHRLLHIP